MFWQESLNRLEKPKNSSGHFGHLYRHSSYTLPKDKWDNPLVVKNFKSVQYIKEMYEGVGSPPMRSGEDMLSLFRKIKAKYPKVVPAHPYRYNRPDDFTEVHVWRRPTQSSSVGNAIDDAHDRRCGEHEIPRPPDGMAPS